MAKLKNPVLGNVSGAVGNIVFTEKGDSSFLYRKPPVKEVTPTGGMIAVRAKFKLLSSMSGGINSSAELKAMWPHSTKNRRSRFNSIFVTNYDLVHTIEDLGKPVMVPGFGFPLTNGVITPTLKGLTFACDAPGPQSGIDPGVDKYAIACGIVVLSSPVNEGDPSFKVLRVKTGQQALDSESPISLSYEYQGDQLTVFQGYTNKKIYLVIITLDASGLPVKYSVQFNH